MEPNEQNGFSYTYSARERAEISKIREKYAPPEEDKMERVRRLDKSVTQKSTTVSLIIGILGTLIMGMGMSIVMTEFGSFFGDRIILQRLVGIGIGAVGAVLVAIAYPVYSYITKKERARVAPEILRLTEELLK